MPEHSKTSSNSNWNYHPELPLADNSIFKWPPEPSFAANWLRTNWLSLSERVLMLLLAILLWIWVYPDLEAAKEFSSGWIAQVWIINLALVGSIAGGLHLWFIKYNKQNKNLKFDRRDQGKNNKLWNFSDQVKDKRRLALGTFYHQLHHRYYECNYGNQEMPWDRWFGTFNDGTDEATRVTRERKKTMHK